MSESTSNNFKLSEIPIQNQAGEPYPWFYEQAQTTTTTDFNTFTINMPGSGGFIDSNDYNFKGFKFFQSLVEKEFDSAVFNGKPLSLGSIFKYGGNSKAFRELIAGK